MPIFGHKGNFLRRVTHKPRQWITYAAGITLTRHEKTLTPRQTAVRRTVRVRFWSALVASVIFGVALMTLPGLKPVRDAIMGRHNEVADLCIRKDDIRKKEFDRDRWNGVKGNIEAAVTVEFVKGTLNVDRANEIINNEKKRLQEENEELLRNR